MRRSLLWPAWGTLRLTACLALIHHELPVSHTALARTYRPRRFAEVFTQEHVSETLRRAVAGGRVGHAYLFCGPRGVGKTTLARVLAMALNCPHRTAEGEPCGDCESCRRIWGGQTALDVVEIDAATNRGVDDARDLRERAMYAPSDEGRYKVYIVDEAHMLTREAWNALLKVLEEPPPRVIFVFATTEPQKIQQAASPVLSRCQRFDFHRIGTSDIVRRLRQVSESEGYPAEEEALRTIARRAEGGMRDALSLLDQVLALTGGEVTLEAVRRVLGLVEEERYIRLLEILRTKKSAEVFPFVEAILEEGYDMVEFHRGLVEVLRTLLRLRLKASPPSAGKAPADEKSLARWSREFAPGDLLRMLTMATELEVGGGLRRSPQPHLLVELLLLRMSYLDRTVELESLLEAIGSEADRGSVPELPSSRRPSSGEAVGRHLGSSRQAKAPPPSPPTEPPDNPVTVPSQESPSLSHPASRGGPVTLAEAWAALLSESGGYLPRGITPFLRGARVEFPPQDCIQVHIPPGPGLAKLREPEVQAALKKALQELYPSAAGVRLEVLPWEGQGPQRIGPQSPVRDRMAELMATEPGLEEAVQELDLELLG